MKRYYVEEEDGKEIKRKLTTFANDDLTQLSDDELETLYYESSAQFLAKAMALPIPLAPPVINTTLPMIKKSFIKLFLRIFHQLKKQRFFHLVQ